MTLSLVDRSILALCALQEVNQELEELEVPGESGFLPGLHQTTSELYTAEMVDITRYRVKTAVLTRYRHVMAKARPFTWSDLTSQ